MSVFGVDFSFGSFLWASLTLGETRKTLLLSSCQDVRCRLPFFLFLSFPFYRPKQRNIRESRQANHFLKRVIRQFLSYCRKRKSKKRKKVTGSFFHSYLSLAGDWGTRDSSNSSSLTDESLSGFQFRPRKSRVSTSSRVGPVRLGAVPSGSSLLPPLFQSRAEWWNSLTSYLMKISILSKSLTYLTLSDGEV